ncbi:MULTISPECIES: SDR family NAD(P)-dependent oxidoreductase [Pseudonocardia]|uniref:Protochlorophyllide oxidoreductase n=2 Tax=Pseudonocardia TaxID=1847 RepID=A0A1Y2N0T8_PSEAH|nr:MULTISPECIES: SDR family NAD(P)-dependent oxidoreductase [Pseudonocardia]OSY40717.1 protochlorophyllide oxidoreductase [Pseudonocardia autotrophica]TDN71976.1 NAD(P)-dependent dehydrogenase (short-subunit alcohol dehydrogenase family) [Pseudonocardia autotrophica]BBG02663.1 putative dehydrogenase/reductase [Pseudonocardia autotrophica]GEC24722.1 putative dehydrogenase/reductase [Pseudonocardia saturnea]
MSTYSTYTLGDATPMTTIVMTGGTSGFGLLTAHRFLETPSTRLLLGARGPAPAGAETIPLDLARLSSVRSFAEGVADRLGTGLIDAVVLNAGVSPPDVDGRTPDGFETAFAVNHLAHYLLLRLLAPRLAPEAVIVLTTSGTHDPAGGTMIPPPRHANAELLAHPERDPGQETRPRAAAGQAYSSSKLCNILTARALALQPEVTAKNVTVLAYDPGPTPGTGLLRNAPPMAGLAWRASGPLLRRLVRRFNSKEAVGGNLAAIALGTVRPAAGQYYAAVRRDELTWTRPSELARDDRARDALWQDSAVLLGLEADRS